VLESIVTAENGGSFFKTEFPEEYTKGRTGRSLVLLKYAGDKR